MICLRDAYIFDRDAYRQLFENILSVSSYSGKFRVKHLRSFGDVRLFNPMLVYLIECGACSKIGCCVGLDNKIIRNILYKRNFEFDEIGKYLNKIRSIYAKKSKQRDERKNKYYREKRRIYYRNECEKRWNKNMIEDKHRRCIHNSCFGCDVFINPKNCWYESRAGCLVAQRERKLKKLGSSCGDEKKIG